MRVLILATDIYTRGGIARYTSALASALADLIGPTNVHVLPLLGARHAGAISARYRLLSPVADRLTAAGKFRFAARAVGLGGYDLTICTHLGLSPVAALRRLLFGTPFWVACHGREAWPRFPADVRWAVGWADLLLPISRFTAEMVGKVNRVPESRMRVLHNAIPDDFAGMLTSPDASDDAAEHTGESEKRVLSVGMVSTRHPYKGFDTVIRALPRVLEAVPKARYIVVGEGDNIEYLKALARGLGVRERIEFTGGVPDADLARYYRACNVFALPSRTEPADGDGWHGEGFGRVYVEAALAGKPVVGSIGGGAAEAVLNGKTGLLVDSASVSDVANAIIRLLQSPEAAAKMGREGQRWALANFTSGALKRRLGELLSRYGLAPDAEPWQGGDVRYVLAAGKASYQSLQDFDKHESRY